MTEQHPPDQDPHGGTPPGGQGGAAPGWGQRQPPGGAPYGSPPPAWGPQPPAPPGRRFGRGVLIGCLGAVVLLIVIVAVLVLAFGGSSGKKSPPSPTTTNSGVRSSEGAHPPAADVSITSCELDPSTSFASAKLKIINHSSKPSDYSISVEFLAANGTRVGEGGTLQTHVAPGETAEDTASSPTQATGNITCKVTSVERFSSAG